MYCRKLLSHSCSTERLLIGKHGRRGTGKPILSTGLIYTLNFILNLATNCAEDRTDIETGDFTEKVSRSNGRD